MALLHAKQLYGAKVSSYGAFINLYTVPTGYRVILRSVCFRNDNGSVVQQAFLAVSGEQLMSQGLQKSGTPGDSFEWRPWVVMDQTAVLQVYLLNAAATWIYASGSLYTI